MAEPLLAPGLPSVAPLRAAMNLNLLPRLLPASITDGVAQHEHRIDIVFVNYGIGRAHTHFR